MGSCLSKKSAFAAAASPPVPPLENPKSESQLETKKTEDENIARKDIFIIKHRKSHEIERPADVEKGESEKPDAENGKNLIPSNGSDGHGGVAPVRTSSCTKEEVDAILIQCGRLSRSSSAAENGGRKYSGSKRSYDFDSEGGNGDDNAAAREGQSRRREQQRQSQGRRRTPSRERERDQQQQRPSSRERDGSGGGRRVSRSPGKRSESPTATNSNSRPGKMVSVPATVASLGGEGNASAVKRIHVNRNVSPRARSPVRVRASNANQQQPISLSRSNSRKAEHSPYRRNPLAEIDTNIISQKPNADNKTVQVVSENRNNNLTTTNASSKNQQEQHQPIVSEETTYGIIQSHVGLNVISSSGPKNPKTQPLTRSRSSRLSQDLDINPDTLSSHPNNNTSSSYTALLLEDIHNFHQKNTITPPPPSFTLPPCVTKACSILEAVADLNSSTCSNLSSVPKKIKPEAKDPILESEVAANDDLMEPSFHKYVTVRRGTLGGDDDDDMEEQESSGSNSFAGSQQHWVSSSSWEPNSAQSTDRWTSSSSSLRPAARQGVVDESGKKVSDKKNGTGLGRMGTRKSNTTAVST